MAARCTPEVLLGRDAPGGLALPDHRSANRDCQLLAARDGWVALNLARREDRELVPALTAGAGDDWEALARTARSMAALDFCDKAIELQLPVAVAGETSAPSLAAAGAGAVPRRVVDLTALWAGPLSTGLLVAAGAEVIRIDSLGRPDPTPTASPDLDRRLNGRKRRLPLDLRRADDRARLRDLVLEADVLVTSARAAALARLGLVPDVLLAENPRLIWVAITGHGFAGDGAGRVGFGDDCAAAGGLLDWCQGVPCFLGDALADPLTGLEAALVALRQVASGDGGLIDMAMARVAAGYARALE